MVRPDFAARIRFLPSTAGAAQIPAQSLFLVSRVSRTGSAGLRTPGEGVGPECETKIRMENEPFEPRVETTAGAEPAKGRVDIASPGSRGVQQPRVEVSVAAGDIMLVNGLTYQVVDLDAKLVQLRRVTCEYCSDGRVRRFVYGGDQELPGASSATAAPSPSKGKGLPPGVRSRSRKHRSVAVSRVAEDPATRAERLEEMIRRSDWTRKSRATTAAAGGGAKPGQQARK